MMNQETTNPVGSSAERTYRSPTESQVSIRVASPNDAEALRGMLSRASSETIYLRFHIPYVEVPEWMTGLMLGVGQREMEALVAVVRGEIVGHAMYIGLGPGDAAEMAIIVEDDWQSQGVGKMLLSRLAARARLRGIGVFVGEVLHTNQSMLGLAAMFPETSYTTEDGVCQVRMKLGTPVTKTDQRAA